MSSHDKVVEFLRGVEKAPAPRIAKGTGLSASTVRRVLQRSGAFGCTGQWADAKGVHGIREWFVEEELLTDTPRNGWLCPNGKLYPCDQRGHVCLADGYGGELVIERLGWMKLARGEFLVLLMEGPPTQAQINRVCDYYKATNAEHEFSVFMSVVTRREKWKHG